MEKNDLKSAQSTPNVKHNIIYPDSPIDLLAHRYRNRDQHMPEELVEFYQQSLLHGLFPQRGCLDFGRETERPIEEFSKCCQRVHVWNINAMVQYREASLRTGIPEIIFEFYWKHMLTSPEGVRLEFCVPLDASYYHLILNILCAHGAHVNAFDHISNGSYDPREGLVAISAHWAPLPGLPYPSHLRAAVEELNTKLRDRVEFFARLHLSAQKFDTEILLSGAFAGWDKVLDENLKE